MTTLKNTTLLVSLAAALASAPAAADECDTPRIFAEGVISTEAWEWRLSFKPHALQAYWARTETWWPGTREQAKIYTAYHLPWWGWTMPRVAEFSGVYSDMDPYVSPTGRYLVFSSERPRPDGAQARMDLWIATRDGLGWSEPRHLGDAVNSAGDELYASMDLRGNLYFGSDREGEWGIYRSRRLHGGSYAPAEKLPGQVNTTQRWEFNPEISPDGRTLLFVRLDLPDALPDQGYGFGDIYVSRRGANGFGEAVNLGPCVNTAYDEFHPSAQWWRDTLYFARDVGAPSNFYVTELALPPAP